MSDQLHNTSSLLRSTCTLIMRIHKSVITHRTGLRHKFNWLILSVLSECPPFQTTFSFLDWFFFQRCCCIRTTFMTDQLIDWLGSFLSYYQHGIHCEIPMVWTLDKHRQSDGTVHKGVWYSFEQVMWTFQTSAVSLWDEIYRTARYWTEFLKTRLSINT